MIGLIAAVITFNLIAFKTNKRLTPNQIVHIWAFTIAFQQAFDIIIEFKYHGYWYFDKDIDWKGFIPHTILIPPVNMMFLNWYPFRKKRSKQTFYILLWSIGILVYEAITLLPEPWGYFNYGWWTLWHAAVIDPILFMILLQYYKWITKLEGQLQP
ncbi:hypothetical protein [Cytobacillus gottheilii]|uniref:hypothetical protein n=1 Tax=Cytobacillus gottheilii TaxID=859144 RepID=UPI002494399E|nr:hypothetical protein [Cytobacillus gottheilii]